MDGFKQINDSRGHKVGDEVLREVAKRFSQSICVTDTVARVGGDEFLFVLTDLKTPDYGKTIAEKLLGVLDAPIMVQDNEIKIGVSIGISFYPIDSEDMDALINLADNAMYRVKTSQKNGYAFANQHINQ